MSARAFYGGSTSASSADVLTAGEMAFSRDLAISNQAGGTSGTFQLAYFTASRSETINTVTVWTGTTLAAATPTLIRFGIYSIAANGAGTLVASTANDTTLLAAAHSEYSKALSAPFAKTVGLRYAAAVLVVSGAAVPTYMGQLYSGTTTSYAFLARSPRKTGRILSQTDLPASFADASVLGVGYRIAMLLS